MSWQAQTAVTHHSKIKKIMPFRLLMYLADGADENGRIDPAPNQETLAEFYGCTTRAVRKWFNHLYESGELELVRKGSGPGNASAFQICLEMPLKGGIKQEPNNVQTAILQKLESLEKKVGQLEKTIEEMKDEYRNQTGTNTGTKQERIQEQRRNAFQSKRADDPSFDPSFDPLPPNPQGGMGFALDPDGNSVPLFEDEETATAEVAADEAERAERAEIMALVQVFSEETKNKPLMYQKNGEYQTQFITKWIHPLQNMLEVGNGRTADAIRAGIAEMRREKLRFSTPNSIKAVVLEILQEQCQTPPNGRPTTPSTGEYGGII